MHANHDGGIPAENRPRVYIAALGLLGENTFGGRLAVGVDEYSTTCASAGDALDFGGSAGPINLFCSCRLGV